MDPWQPVQRSFHCHWEGDYNHWEGGQGRVDISVQSMPTATDPQLVGRAQVTFYHQIGSILIGAPPNVPNEELLTPPVHESWLEDLQTFWSFEQTVAAQNMFAHIRNVPYMPIVVQDYFISVITNQARGSAVNAAALHSRAVSMVIDLDISINWIYDDDYDDGADGDDDGGSYAAEMDEAAGEAEAEADPVVGGADVESAAAEGVMGDAEGHPTAPEEVIGGADVDLPAPEGVVGVAEVDPRVPEGVVGEAEVIAGIGDIVLVGDPPRDPEEFVPLDTLLPQPIGQPLAPLLEAVGLQRGSTPAAIAHHLTVDTFMGGSPRNALSA